MVSIVVGAGLARRPLNGGGSSARLQWILGLRRLGFEVYLIDQLGPEGFVDDAGAVTPLRGSPDPAHPPPGVGGVPDRSARPGGFRRRRRSRYVVRGLAEPRALPADSGDGRARGLRRARVRRGRRYRGCDAGRTLRAGGSC